MRSAYTTPLFGLAFLIPCVALAATASPSFSAPNDFGIAPKIRSLAAVAGPDWREIAEKNRTTGLHKLGDHDLVLALRDVSRKYAGSNALDVGKVPLDELGEIAEAAFRGGLDTEPYGWALWRSFFSSDAKVSDRATAAKLLAGFDRGLAGVVPKDANVVSFSPSWKITSFQTGKYRTTLPGGGYFESAWSYSMGQCAYDIFTSAKEIRCQIKLALGIRVYTVTVNGEDVDFNGSTFTAIPDKDGVARIKVYYLWAGSPKKRKK